MIENNIPVTNIKKFKIVKPFNDHWKSLMQNKIIEYIINFKHSSDYSALMEHAITRINNNTPRSLEGIKLSWMANPHILNNNEMLINVISE